MGEVWSIVMAGGVGSRFWPLSRARRPKQLLDILGQGPMLRVAVERALPLVPWDRQVVVSSELLASQVQGVLPELSPEHLLAEPVGRNTAPAVAWGALHIAARDPDALAIVLSADHHIADVPAFRAALTRALEVARQGHIVTLGIRPTRPETGYGYIRRGEALGDDVFEVAAFVEKPDAPTALGYLAAGTYDWNAGIFVFPVALMLAELTRWQPGLMSAMTQGPPEAAPAIYPELDKISIDVAVMERTDRAAVVPTTCGWSDVGSWQSLWDLGERTDGSSHRGDVIELDGAGNVLVAADGGVVAAVGVEGLVVVHTADATLVCPVEASQRVREVVDALGVAGLKEVL